MSFGKSYLNSDSPLLHFLLPPHSLTSLASASIIPLKLVSLRSAVTFLLVIFVLILFNFSLELGTIDYSFLENALSMAFLTTYLTFLQIHVGFFDCFNI